jgi:hypothetical protein
MSADPYAFASLMAEQIIKGEGIVTLPIDPKAFARGKGFEVEAKPPNSAGVSGMLVRVGNEFAIAYSTHLDNEGFENFSVGHELGHFYLRGHIDAVIPGGDGIHESRAGFNSKDRYEIEADRFSAGFLMPRHLFFPAMERAGRGLVAIECMSALCKTSLHATAIRFVQCTREPMAIVISIGRHIDHCFMSDALKNTSGIDWLRKREAVPTGTPTQLFNQEPGNVSRGIRWEQTSQLQQWFGGNRRMEISEDVVGLGHYGKTLTVLYDIYLPEPEEEEEEAQLIESWTPRFKR